MNYETGVKIFILAIFLTANIASLKYVFSWHKVIFLILKSEVSRVGPRKRIVPLYLLRIVEGDGNEHPEACGYNWATWTPEGT